MERPFSRHSFEEHTGEVRLVATAPSCEHLFAQTGQALAELMLGESAAPTKLADEVVVELHARDRAALLVAWLNELIFLSETRKVVFTRFRIEHVDDRFLRAAVTGVPTESIKTAVKAATLHRASVLLREGQWHASVVLDV